MSGERHLAALLRGLRPVVADGEWVFTTCAPDAVPPGVQPFAVVREDEGVTLVLRRDDAVAAGLADGPPHALLTLQVHSDLAAVGLTAAVSTALAGAGIPCNVVAGYFHDHLLVPSDRAGPAVEVLEELSRR